MGAAPPTWLRTVAAGAAATTKTFTEVALFFNLDTTKVSTPDKYATTKRADVTGWLAVGNPDRSTFLHRYWAALSYGKLQLSVVANTDSDGRPVIPTIDPANHDAGNWEDIAKQIIQGNPARIWRLGGRITDGEVRVIPSVCVVQNYDVHASAWTAWGWSFTDSGHSYRADDICHLGITDTIDVLAHENGHNFLASGDLYGGGGGKIGYWDLLGDALSPGKMSDTSSYFKTKLGWTRFTDVIRGPSVSARGLSLRPYATSGECYKVLPDPKRNPDEYFLLEYRTTTGTEDWRPDGSRNPGGLLITHVNERIGEDGSTSTPSSPFMDVEECDGNDGKCWDDRGYCDLPWNDRANNSFTEVGGAAYASNNWPEPDRGPGTLFPTGRRNRFGHDTDPSSAFYGGRRSGLSLTDISADGLTCSFTLQISGSNQQALSLPAGWRASFGDFDGDGLDELLVFTGSTLAVVDCVENQWHVVWRADGRLGQWAFRPIDRLTVGDFNGDGRADVFVHSDHWAGLFLSDGGSLRNVWITGDPAKHGDWIGGWHLSGDDRVLAGDFDGDGRTDLFLVNGGWAAILRSTGVAFEQGWISGDPAKNANWVGGWHLSGSDRHQVADFDGDGRDDVFVHAGGWAALLRSTGDGFDLGWISGDPAKNANWVGGWRISAADAFLAGDFDGDGRADLWVHNGSGWAGWWRSTGFGFQQAWISGDPAKNANWIDGWHLGPQDRYVVADLDGDGRDDLYVRSDQWAAEVLSDGTTFHVEWMSGDPATGGNTLGPITFDSPRDREFAARTHYLPQQGIFQARADGGTAAMLRVPDNDIFRLDPSWVGPAEFASRDERVPVQRYHTGRFVDPHSDALLVSDGSRLSIWTDPSTTPALRGRSGEWIGGWHLGPDDRFTVGDLDGDGLDEIFVRSSGWGAMLRWRDADRSFRCDWISGDPAHNANWVGGWHLGPTDKETAVDLDGDGRTELFVRSPRCAGVFRWNGSAMTCPWMTGDPAASLDWIGGWHLGRQDRAIAGRFRGLKGAELFVRSPQWAGLLAWTGTRLEAVWISGDPAQNANWVGGWHLGPADRETPGRFTTSASQVLVRSRSWAGLFGWDAAAGVIRCPWMTGDPAANLDWVGGWHLSAGDRVSVADVDGNGRDEVIIRSANWIGLLGANGSGLGSRIVHERDLGNWRLNAFDRTERLRRGAGPDAIFLHHPYGWTGAAEVTGSGGSAAFSLTSAQFRELVG